MKLIIALLLVILVFFVSSVFYTFLLRIDFLTDIIRNYPTLPQHFGMLIVSLILIHSVSKGRVKEYGLNLSFAFPVKKLIVASLLLGFFSGLIVTLSGQAPENLPWEDMTVLEMILLIWLLASITEEILFRGLIQNYLRDFRNTGIKLKQLHLSLPVIVSALLFGFVHLTLFTLGAGWVFVLTVVSFATLLGLLAGYFTESSGSITPAIIAHICFNIGGSFLGFFM